MSTPNYYEGKIMEHISKLAGRDQEMINNPVGISGHYMDLENQKKIAEAIRYTFLSFLNK